MGSEIPLFGSKILLVSEKHCKFWPARIDLGPKVANLLRGKTRQRVPDVAARRLGEDEAYLTVRDILSEASTGADGALSRERSGFYRCGFATLGYRQPEPAHQQGGLQESSVTAVHFCRLRWYGGGHQRDPSVAPKDRGQGKSRAR